MKVFTGYGMSETGPVVTLARRGRSPDGGDDARTLTKAGVPIPLVSVRVVDEDMGDLPQDVFETLRDRAEVQLGQMLRTGEYVGWLAAPAATPETIVAGAGIFLRPSLPSPKKVNGLTVGVTTGRLGLLINVFTEPAWRRRGIGVLLMQQAIAWCRANDIDRLILHASDAGRPLYEKMGFKPTNEMRLESL
jgi:GNAT superfamily N-acetyltransferase